MIDFAAMNLARFGDCSFPMTKKIELVRQNDDNTLWTVTLTYL